MQDTLTESRPAVEGCVKAEDVEVKDTPMHEREADAQPATPQGKCNDLAHATTIADVAHALLSSDPLARISRRVVKGSFLRGWPSSSTISSGRSSMSRRGSMLLTFAPYILKGRGCLGCQESPCIVSVDDWVILDGAQLANEMFG